ncbi:hypothetical protein Asi02nite_16650 [Asanoa siamensis]|uniref:Asparaginase n=1 Tax=Asanoa siamensis TaxID=926357 RepID=A0ABQ4CLI5_9ACTN|nr:hypothetical protein Asi02nite_16650 [Asanoa siamensis]
MDVLTALAAAKPVVLASRIGAGPVLTHTYGYPGAEADLIARGLIPAGTLDPWKARVLLAGGADRDRLTSTFATIGLPTDQRHVFPRNARPPTVDERPSEHVGLPR